MYVLVRACIGAAPIIFFDIQLLKTEIKKPDFLDTCIYRALDIFLLISLSDSVSINRLTLILENIVSVRSHYELNTDKNNKSCEGLNTQYH
jgi:hypothetical protein